MRPTRCASALACAAAAATTRGQRSSPMVRIAFASPTAHGPDPETAAAPLAPNSTRAAHCNAFMR
jgi:hypothetical protein